MSKTATTTQSPLTSISSFTPRGGSELWQRLRITRNLAGLTQAELAEKMHVTRPALTFWENKNPKHRTQMSGEQLQRYCRLTGVSMGLLMDDTLSQDEYERAAARERTTELGAVVAPRISSSQATGMAFFAAVRFGVMAANPSLADAFDVVAPAGELGLTASFAVAGHVVQFVVQQTGAVDEGDRLQIVKETGHLMLVAAAMAHGTRRAAPRKHLILFTSTGKYSMQGRAEFESIFGVELFIGGDVGATVKYLLDMV